MTDQPETQAPALNRRRVGDYVVTYLSDGYLDGSFGYLSGIEEAEAKAMVVAAHRPPLAHFAIASYVIQGQGRTILVDAGTGGFNGWGGRFRVALAAAGIEPESVDTVLMTHAHVDHVGGLTLHGAPLFTKAEVIVNEAEVKFWRDDAIMSSVPADAKRFFEAARAAFDAYDKVLRPVSGGEVLPGISLVPLPGHTPGHSGFHIQSCGEQLLIWADITHMEDIQIRRPEVTIGFDVDPDQARSTRMRILDQVASDELIVAGMHLNMPGFLMIEREGTGYAKVSVPWSPSLWFFTRPWGRSAVHELKTAGRPVRPSWICALSDHAGLPPGPWPSPPRRRSRRHSGSRPRSCQGTGQAHKRSVGCPSRRPDEALWSCGR